MEAIGKQDPETHGDGDQRVLPSSGTSPHSPQHEGPLSPTSTPGGLPPGTTRGSYSIVFYEEAVDLWKT